MVKGAVKISSILKVLSCQPHYNEKWTWNAAMEKEKQPLHVKFLLWGKELILLNIYNNNYDFTIWSKNVVLWLGCPISAVLGGSLQGFHSPCWCRIHFCHRLNNLSCLWGATQSLLPDFFARSYTDCWSGIQIFSWSIARVHDFEG